MKAQIFVVSIFGAAMIAAYHVPVRAQQPPATAQPPATTQPPDATQQPPATQPPATGAPDQPAQPGALPKTVWDGAYSDAQAKRGEAVYGTACASCHGPALDGGEMAPPLVGAAFGADWNDLSLGDLFERIRTSMPQDRPGSLTRQDNADVLAYILSMNKFPAGQADLPTQTEMLNQIKYETEKPGSGL